VPTSRVPTLLLVDDDEVFQAFFQRSLARMKLETPLVIAADGAEALGLLRGEGGRTPLAHPCLVLLDIHTPRLDGPGFLAELRCDPELKETLVFVLSSTVDEQSLRATYRFNPAGYIVKDADAEVLQDMLELLRLFSRVVAFP